MAQRGYYTSPTIVTNLLIINILVFMVQLASQRSGASWIDTLALYPLQSGGFRIWQPLTYMFMHGGMEHIFFNMFALWMFGRQIEYDLGSRRFLTMYMVAGIGAGILQLIVCLFIPAITVGASGAIFGILLAFGLLHPNNMIMLLFPPIPFKAKWFVLGYGVIELLLGVFGSGGNVAHFAHVGGMLWAWMLLAWWKKKGVIYYQGFRSKKYY